MLEYSVARGSHLAFTSVTDFEKIYRAKQKDCTDLMRQRRIWSEGTFAILKACHGLRRAIRRGLDNMQEQLLMASTALNMRRMVAVMK